ncbi:MAG: hypothetical protein ABJP92_12855, partial [Flavobacteriaceae bacterium]
DGVRKGQRSRVIESFSYRNSKLFKLFDLFTGSFNTGAIGISGINRIEISEPDFCVVFGQNRPVVDT